MIKPCSANEENRKGSESKSLNLLICRVLQDTNTISARFSLFTVMAKIRRVFEIKFRGRRWAGPQRRLMSGTQLASRLLRQKPDDFIQVRSYCLLKICMIFYKPSTKVITLAIEFGTWRGCVGLTESIIITGKVGTGDDTQLLDITKAERPIKNVNMGRSIDLVFYLPNTPVHACQVC